MKKSILKFTLLGVAFVMVLSLGMSVKANTQRC